MEKTYIINFCDDLRRRTWVVNFFDDLRRRNLLDDITGKMLEENVAMFLFIIGHNIHHRVVANCFQHSLKMNYHTFAYQCLLYKMKFLTIFHI